VVSACASGYTWIIKKGEGAALVEGSWVIGNKLTVGSAAGSLRPITTADTTFVPTVAEVIRTAAATEYGLVKWCLD